jgi:beta-glucosidase
MKKPSMFSFLILLVMSTLVGIAQQTVYTYPFQNPSLSEDQRVGDLVSRMTLKEKADQLLYTAPAIPRLGIPSYNWSSKGGICYGVPAVDHNCRFMG